MTVSSLPRILFFALVPLLIPSLSGCEWFTVLAVPQEPQTSAADEADKEADPG